MIKDKLFAIEKLLYTDIQTVLILQGKYFYTRFSYGFNETECYQTTQEADGGSVGLIAFESALINGKGQ